MAGVIYIAVVFCNNCFFIIHNNHFHHRDQQWVTLLIAVLSPALQLFFNLSQLNFYIIRKLNLMQDVCLMIKRITYVKLQQLDHRIIQTCVFLSNSFWHWFIIYTRFHSNYFTRAANFSRNAEKRAIILLHNYCCCIILVQVLGRILTIYDANQNKAVQSSGAK